MRHSNKFLALLTATAMAFSMTVTALADESAPADTGTDTTTVTDTENTQDTGDAEQTEGEDAGDAEDDADSSDGADKDDADSDDDAKDDADSDDASDTAKPAALNYTDVTEANWYHGAVAFVTEKKLIDGLTDTTFGPSENMTRQMLAVALYRLAGSPEVKAENPFTDVADDAAYRDAVVWAYGEGIVNGTTATTFAPNDPIQRQAIAAMLARCVGADAASDTSNLNAFSDASAIQDYAKGSLSWAVANELIKGNADGTVDPRGNASRAAVATILERFAPMAAPSSASDVPAGDDDTAPSEDAGAADDSADNTDNAAE